MNECALGTGTLYYRNNIGNRAKGRISKQSTSNFPKNEHFSPPDTHT